MSRVSYFQRFSQRENHATNNTLLVLRYFYQASPLKLQRVLTSLVDTELSIGLTFEQQVRGDQSIPDAVIQQEPLRIYIETKRGENLDPEQIKRHIETIALLGVNSGQAIQLGLTREPLLPNVHQELRQMAAGRGLLFASTTFSQVVESLRSQCADYESALLEIMEDYEQYLSEEKLLDGKGSRMAVFPCGDSYADNHRFGLYYEPYTRSCKSHSLYLGIYTAKRALYVGQIVAIAICDYRASKLECKEEIGVLGTDQKARIQSAIDNISYHDLKTHPHRFYLADELVETSLEKISSGGLRSHQNLKLGDIIGAVFDPRRTYTSQEMAQLLRDKTFG